MKVSATTGSVRVSGGRVGLGALEGVVVGDGVSDGFGVALGSGVGVSDGSAVLVAMGVFAASQPDVQLP